MASWTGELAVYMEQSKDRQAADHGFTASELDDINSGDTRRWLRGLQTYTLRWVVEQNRMDANDIADDSGLRTAEATTCQPA